LEGHTANVCAVCFHPELPVILTGAEDGTVRVWHSSTYRLENTLNYGLERVWAMAYQPGSNSVAIAYDEGSIMIKVRVGHGIIRGHARPSRARTSPAQHACRPRGYSGFLCCLQFGREEPAMSMDNSGKLIMARHSEVQQANLVQLDEEPRDGEPMALTSKVRFISPTALGRPFTRCLAWAGAGFLRDLPADHEAQPQRPVRGQKDRTCRSSRGFVV
jgi:coatomer subunit beta'